MNQRKQEADYIRAVCTVWIIALWHLPDYMESSGFCVKLTGPLPSQITFSVLAVFTYLSGYFSCRNKISGAGDAFRYYKKRLIRIYPLFAAACLAFAVLSINPKNTVPYLLSGFGFLKYPYPLTLWFVCMLLVFYFFAPFLAYQAGKKSYMVLGILSVFIETVFFMVHKMLDADIRLFYYWPFFVSGMACSGIDISFLLQAAAERGGVKISRFFIWIKGYLIWISFPLYILLAGNAGTEFNFYTIICSLFFLICMYSFGSMLSGKSFRIYGLVREISYASMCAYLFHRPILQIIMIFCGKLSILAAYAGALPVIFIVSHLIQRLYDNILRPGIEGVLKN